MNIAIVALKNYLNVNKYLRNNIFVCFFFSKSMAAPKALKQMR